MDSGSRYAPPESRAVEDNEVQSGLNSQGIDSRYAHYDNTERHGRLRTQESFNSRRHSISGRRSSGHWGIGSLSFSKGVSSLISDDIQSEINATAGDIGDRVVTEEGYDAVSSSILQEIGSFRHDSLSFPDDALVWPCGMFLHDPNYPNYPSPVSPLTEEILSPLPTDPVLYNGDKSQDKLEAANSSEKDGTKRVPKLLLYISCVAHLAVFGIMGVFVRYLLQKLFGPSVADITSDQSSLYLDLPSNMVGSFFMGWFGVVFKGSISHTSEFLAIGLTTGFLGSLTTFSGWNQKMLDLSVDGRWPAAAFGILAGMMLAVSSIYLGVLIANGFRELVTKIGLTGIRWKLESCKSHTIVLVIMLLVLGILWGVSGELLRSQLKHNHSTSQLWLACLVGPVGVWIRWRLARWNGQGLLGRNRSFKWVPFGTLTANILAACLMAALATTKKAVDTRRYDIVVNGIQFGFLGCLSTVSTFVAEIYAMYQSNHEWRAVIYALLTIVPSYVLGTLFYSVPVWAKGYKQWKS
ncbi:fluoride export protein 1 isoform X2 [Aristolochia californica]